MASVAYSLSVKHLQIATSGELRDGQTIKFQFVRDGERTDGFLARFSGEVVAYENKCQHIAINLDSEGGNLFSRDGNHFICQSHGAIYEPLNGLCVRGPCEGETLRKLEIEICDEKIWLTEPATRIIRSG